MLRDLLLDLNDELEFHIIYGEIGIGFRGYINLYKTIKEYKIQKCLGYNDFNINDDLSIDVEGSIFLRNRGLTKLPIKFRNVSGYFDCSENGLTSLDGSPIKVGSDFNCSRNVLTSLEGAPKSVGGDFWCYDNDLTSIDGLPKEIGGVIYCDKGIKHLIPKNYKIGS